MPILNSVDQALIADILTIGRYLHDKIPIIFDLNALYDSGNGLKARLAAMPNSGQDALNELGALNGMTVQELNDIAYVITTRIKPILEDERTQLASTRKFT